MTQGLPMSLVERLPVGIAALHADGRLEPCNDAMRAMLQQAGGPRALADLPLTADQLAGLELGEPTVLEVAGAGGGGQGWFELTVCAEDGQRWLLAADVTTARRQDALLQQAARVRALGGLAERIVHDLNNLSAATIGLADQLASLAPPRDRALLESLSRGTRQGAALLRTLALMLRTGPRQREVMPLRELVRDILMVLDKHLQLTDGAPVGGDDGAEGPLVRVARDEAMQALLTFLMGLRGSAPAGDRPRLLVEAVRGEGASAPRRRLARLVVEDFGDPGWWAKATTSGRPGEPGQGQRLQELDLWLRRNGGVLQCGAGPGGGRRASLVLPAAAAPHLSQPAEKGLEP